MKKNKSIYHITCLSSVAILFVLSANLVTGCAKEHKLQTMHFKPVPFPEVPSQELPPLVTVPPIQALRVAGDYFIEAKESLQKGDKKTAEEKYLTARRTLISGGIVPGIFHELDEFWEKNMLPESEKKINLELINTYKIIEGLKGISPYNSIDFPFPVPERVLCEIEDAQNRYPDRFQEGLDRSGYYNPYIRECLKKEGLPQELCWVVMIESMYKLKAFSTAGAAGMWQFMRSTGEHYNLRIDSYVDERYNWVVATSSAIDYLQRLHDFFNGSWELAISAYNMGEGGLLRAIEANGGNRNFWTLIETAPACYRIKEETKKYYPRFLAYILICNDPVSYGFSPSPYTPIKWDEIEIQGMYTLDILDEVMGYQPGTLSTWNPFLVREVTPPQGCKLMLPAGDGIKLAAALNNSLVKQAELIAYTVKKDETAYHIARKHGISVEELLKINGLNSVKSVKTGKTIQVPSDKKGSITFAKSEHKEKEKDKENQQSEEYYIVKKGETLFTIAKNHNVEVEDLASWNGIKENQRLKVGDKIALKPIKEQEINDSSVPELKNEENKTVVIKNIYYTINSGDTVSAIAKKFSTQPEKIMEMNNLSTKSILRIGQKLIVGKETIEEEAKSEPIAIASNTSTVNTNFIDDGTQKTYKVQKGDTLGKIASLNKISLDNLKKWNNMNENSVLKIGQNLYLYNPESPKVETVNDNQTTGKIYVVKQGDTLSKIAKENNVSLKSVLESNNLKENSRLQIGQKIVLSQNLAKEEIVKPQSSVKNTPINTASSLQNEGPKSDIISPQESVKTVEHVVQPGESLWSISKKYNINVAKITQNNPGINSESLKVGTKLSIPTSQNLLFASETKTIDKTAKSEQQTTTLSEPANQQISEEAKQVAKSEQPSDCIIYQVQPGDNLWIIARRNNVSVSEITQWNNMDKSAQLKIGQAIKIYSNTQQKTVTNNKKQISTSSVKDKKEEQTNTYTVQKGDSLYTISKKTGVPLKRILEINNFNEAKVLQVGENVRISQ